MSIIGIVFLVLSIVLLGLGFYGASVDVVSAVGLAESIGQMKNFYFLLGGLILFIVLYRTAFAKASLRVQHAMSTTCGRNSVAISTANRKLRPRKRKRPKP